MMFVQQIIQITVGSQLYTKSNFDLYFIQMIILVIFYYHFVNFLINLLKNHCSKCLNIFFYLIGLQTIIIVSVFDPPLFKTKINLQFAVLKQSSNIMDFLNFSVYLEKISLLFFIFLNDFLLTHENQLFFSCVIALLTFSVIFVWSFLYKLKIYNISVFKKA